MTPRFRTPSRRPSRPSPHPGGAAGFTLIELLVVLAILGVLAAAGLSLNQSPLPAAVKGTTSSLTGALRNAQALALGSGQQVYLRTTGGGSAAPRLEWGFRILDPAGTFDRLGPVLGSWTLPVAEARFVSIGIGSSDLAAADTAVLPRAVPAIAMHVQNNTAIWTNAFFTGSPTPTAEADCPFFRGNGVISQEFFVTVTGLRSGAIVTRDNRIGLIVVSPRSGITAFAKQEPSAAAPPWSRL